MFAALLGTWLVQAPLVPPGSPTFVPAAREWQLGGAFVLKHEKFLQWHVYLDPLRPFVGWTASLRATWRIELSPTLPALRDVSLALESAPGPDGAIGLLRPSLQYRVPGTEARVGASLLAPAFFTPGLFRAAGGFSRMLRPVLFLSGRF